MPGQIDQGAHDAAPYESPPNVPVNASRMEFRTVCYRRTLRADARTALEAVTSTVRQIGYQQCAEGPTPSAEVRFHALARTVTVRAVDAEPGHCVLVLEFVSLSWVAIGGSALVILPGVLLGAVVKAHDAYFAKGFLNNVQRVLEGRDVGRDSARFPGMRTLRDRLELDDLRTGGLTLT